MMFNSSVLYEAICESVSINIIVNVVAKHNKILG